MEKIAIYLPIYLPTYLFTYLSRLMGVIQIILYDVSLSFIGIENPLHKQEKIQYISARCSNIKTMSQLTFEQLWFPNAISTCQDVICSALLHQLHKLAV